VNPKVQDYYLSHCQYRPWWQKETKNIHPLQFMKIIETMLRDWTTQEIS